MRSLSALQQHSHHTNTFSQSVFQRSAPPSSTYPTPPPPGITNSSSSLAFSLGGSNRQSARTTYISENSQAFFDGFLTLKSREIAQVSSHPVDPFIWPISNANHQFVPEPNVNPSSPPNDASRNYSHSFRQPRTPPPRQRDQLLQESPDPLALTTSNSNDSPSAITPCKRKPVVELESPY